MIMHQCASSISCVMLHSVGIPNPLWQWGFLTMPVTLFGAFLRWLRRFGYTGLTLDEYCEAVEKGLLRKERLIAITFDDGYLDNWVYAYPLLREYGFRATLFMPTDFIDHGLTPRPQWRGGSTYHPPSSGYLNIGELLMMEREGIIDVQSHAASHTWLPGGPRIVDFRGPGDQYYWMDWNDAPYGKWRALIPENRPETWGEPVYEHRKALSGPCFLPNEELGLALRKYAAAQGPDFFHSHGWKEDLRARARVLQKNLPEGTMESRLEYMERAEAELADSAHILGRILGKKINWLCWPGGGYNQELFALAARYYRGTTVSARKHFGVWPRNDDFYDDEWQTSYGRMQGNNGSVFMDGCRRLLRFGPLTRGEGENIRYLSALTNFLYVEELRARNPLVRLVRGGLTRMAEYFHPLNLVQWQS